MDIEKAPMVGALLNKRYKVMNLITFDYNTNAVRTQVTDDGEPLFCANDVCVALGYSNARDAVARHVDEEDVVKRDTPTNSGNQLMTYINESGLYALIFGSKLETAKEFKHWVTSEVLPSIRKTGAYKLPKAEPKDYKLVDLMESAKVVFSVAGIEGAALALALDSVVVNETGKSMLKAAGVQIAAPKQKVLLCPSELGAPLGLSPQQVNKMLAARGLQRKKANGKWEPTEKGKGLGAVVLYVNKQQGTGTLVTQLKWPSDILEQSANI